MLDRVSGEGPWLCGGAGIVYLIFDVDAYLAEATAANRWGVNAGAANGDDPCG